MFLTPGRHSVYQVFSTTWGRGREKRPRLKGAHIFMSEPTLTKTSARPAMNTRTVTTLAMLSAIAYVVMLLSKLLPSVNGFLDFDFKDVIICIGGFTFGPVAAAAVSIVVAFVEMVTISHTGPIGFVMNVLATCSFCCTASFVYKRRHTMRGAILGLTRGAGRNHIIRAALEGIAYQTLDIVGAMQRDSGITLRELKVDGGACANNYLMQTQADIINAPVQRPRCVETTAMGAAYLAGLAVGYWASKEDVVKNWAIDRTFAPNIGAEEREKRIHGWNKALRCAYGWAKD